MTFLGLLLTCLGLFAVLQSPRLLDDTSAQVYDQMLAMRDQPEPSPVPVLVGIDEESLKRFGQWPWPRYRLAALVDELGNAGASVVALDILMSEPDRTSPEVLLRERARDLGETVPVAAVVRESEYNDRVLAKALSSTVTVLGFRFDYSGQPMEAPIVAPRPLQQVVLRQAAGSRPGWQEPSGQVCSIVPLAEAAAMQGFTNAQADPDGVLRRVPVLLSGPMGVSPSLAFAALLQATREKDIHLDANAGEMILTWNNREYPLDSHGNLLLSFRRDPKAFRYISAADVLSGQVESGSLTGQIVFVGAWASGLGDRHVTPLHRSLPGLAVHAVVVDNLLAGNNVARPDWAKGAELILVLLTGLGTTFLLSRYGFWSNLLLILVVMMLLVGGSWELMQRSGLFLSPVVPLLLLGVNTAVLSLFKYGTESRKLLKRTRELVEAQDATIMSMTILSEARDEETGEHILRTQRYIEALARHLKTLPNFWAELDDEVIELLFKSAPLHDIGKIGIPDQILRKPDALTAEEFAIMKTHPQIGAKALEKTVTMMENPDGLVFLNYARQMVESHHEKWDGSGYPYGLSGDAIPLAGRLMALADVYDALISERVYKEAFSHEKAKEMILSGRGGHFDPDVVDAFVATEKRFMEIARELADSPE